MKKETKRYVKSLLYDYGRYDDYVARRRYQLQHPLQQIDENVGGGRAKNKFTNPVLTMLITIDEDERLNNLRIQHEAIRECYDEANVTVKTICEELYFKKKSLRRYGSIEALSRAHKINTSSSNAYRMLDEFLENIANTLHLGLMEDFKDGK
ncbi:transcriptional regulator [Lactobacillus sp. PV037]|uniref:transcriptional regulator n=1 Tax=Lactobacillus sp. PV037 TaxID=2594496 RepID=UPI00223F6EF7|nr:transcriptional regulator [Lactobacillus sp. PV037]QNQ83778.1 transcriptional regulator [Lactobacillus sp. PV037]